LAIYYFSHKIFPQKEDLDILWKVRDIRVRELAQINTPVSQRMNSMETSDEFHEPAKKGEPKVSKPRMSNIGKKPKTVSKVTKKVALVSNAQKQ
jgi:hypothetical protein